MLIDTHCHLNEPAFDPDREAVLARAAEAGVEAMLVVGTTAASSHEVLALAQEYPQLFAVVGIQPNYVAEMQAGDQETIVRLAEDPRVVAIGETGLDRYWDHTPFAAQVEAFQWHLELSRNCGKPFVVHCREAEADTVDVLRQAAKQGPLTGVMHSFCGDLATAQACLELGLSLSFAGMVTFKRNDALREVVAATPLDRLLLETDAPYLAPMPNRGKRNEPGWVAHTAAVVADAKGMSLAELAAITTENARRIFRLPA